MLRIGSLVTSRSVPCLRPYSTSNLNEAQSEEGYVGLIIAEEKRHSAFFPGDEAGGLSKLWTVLWPDGSFCNDWGYSLLEVEQEAAA